VGVLVEINCETDFLARSEEFQQLVKDVAMHVAAAEPRYVSRNEVAATELDKEREIARAQAKNDPKNANKPDQVIDKIVEGRLNKFYEENILLDQPFVKDPAKTVAELVDEKVAKTGEKITIRRFTRYKMGEGLQKREDNFGDDVASLVS
jgi:elongation factor Ts